MSTIRVAAVAAPFGRDLDAAYARIGALLQQARAEGTRLLVLPEACLGGYLSALGDSGAAGTPRSRRERGAQPPALRLDGPELARVRAMARDVVVCLGICEDGGEDRYNTAVCLDGDGILGVHRKVHQPLGENLSYAAGDGFHAFDTPVGRLGLQICYDKAFPEAARRLALDGAGIIASLSAWPGSRTGAAADLADDRWTHRFDLFDRARALENQVVWVAANQSGEFGSLRFVASAKVVGPGGEVLATTGTRPGVAAADVDVDALLAGARRSMFHLRDRRPEAYGDAGPVPALEVSRA
ncbi:carbon-nitrogen hydrolase family protein [Kineococcus sp. R8]|uniref:carbon-nitrogen hydrolase family protein n=1 Tax=Kineococcus siccus TaxID=2696567 RepID=UPI0014133A53|nr:carbon-nitrogen hydrolase family protein [Kineococcus siccus]NAZ81410.1 carbon-nitrogen hydrolase family protein [Kineococcus siccus]